MSRSHLAAHCGGRAVTAEELRAVEAPEPTRTWFPLSHHAVARTVQEKLAEAGFTVERARYLLARKDARFFGTLDLSTVLAPGVGLAVGVRNSTDKSLPIGFCAGSRVFVCDNLAFSSEVVVARKHTRYGADRYAEALSRAVAGLHAFREAQAARIGRLQEAAIDDTVAEALMLRAYEQGVVGPRLLPRVIKEWREPSFEEFQPRTLWSLFNAFTGVLAGRQKSNAQQFAALTIRLSDLVARAAGLSPEGRLTLSA